ncbi:MAG TPA: hypothetical protein VKB38_10715 [Terracidiphilus sp.]|nr:hypothetical protein [Terracidiphilus sp.]
MRDRQARLSGIPFTDLSYLLSAVVFAAVLSGCSSSSTVKAGPISITDPTGGASGQLKSLFAGSSVQVNMSPVGDTADAGVNWTVTCGGNPVTGSVVGGACGTFVPAHTPDGVASVFTTPATIPIGNSVTITAAVAGDPSAVSSITMPVVSLPVSISLVNPPTSVVLGGKANFQVRLLNGNGGDNITWTAMCGSSPCGSFSSTVTANGQAGVFIAPASMPASGNVIVITAALENNTSVAVSTNLTILPVSVSLTPTVYNLKTVGTTKFTATVTNDTALNKGVDWTVSCAGTDCGSISPQHTASGTPASFTAPQSVPNGGTVTITAASTTQPTVSATATTTVLTNPPIAVAFTVPPPSSVAVGATANLTASVTYDGKPSNGVNWTCAPAGSCGTFAPAFTQGNGRIFYSVNSTYTAPATAPAGGVVTIIASSAAPPTTPSNPATATTTMAVAPTIAISQEPPSALTAGTSAPVSATVKNDLPPGGVTWTLKCNNTVAGCGWIVPYKTASGQTATYTAPPVATPGTVVTLRAFPSADFNVSAFASAINITPATAASISFVGNVPSQLQPAATVNLAAAIGNDSANFTNEGVDWQVCGSGCGYFIVKPATPAIPATATTPFVPAAPAVTAPSVQGWPNGLPIAYTAPITPPQGGTVTVTAADHADSTTNTQSTIAITSAGTGPALNGSVMAGSQPVVGATVQLFAAGTAGYGSAALALTSPNSTSTPVTDGNGKFTIPAGYACASSGQIYVIATGGTVGTNQPNADLAMMTGLGPCGSLSSQSFVVNEATTVASVWALAPFASNDALTGKSSYLYLGSSSSNTAGLADAFSTVNNLVDISTGTARYFVPAGNATAPFEQINTLADILNACTSTSGGSEGDGSPCGNLLAAADPLSYNYLFQSTAPGDSLQAAFNIAQHPRQAFGYNIDVGYLQAPLLFNLATPTAPFQPILPSAPNDWSLSLNFTGGGGLSSTSAANFFAIDASDDLWITDSKAGTVIEWNDRGTPVSPSTGFAAGGGPMAIDSSGNIWISGNGTLTELTDLGAAYPWSPYKGIADGGTDMAFDAVGNVWIGNGSGVAEFSNLGAELSPTGGYVNSGVTDIGPIVLDSSGDVWVQGTTLAELSGSSGQLIINTLLGASGITQIAAGGSGHVWVPLPQNFGFCEVTPANTTLLYTANCPPGGASGGGASVATIYNPQGIAVDGSGYVWIANAGSTLNQISANVTEVDGSDLSQYAGYQSASLGNGPVHLAIDRAGNVWVLLAGGSMTEYVGIATPVVTPISLGVKNGKLGAKP